MYVVIRFKKSGDYCHLLLFWATISFLCFKKIWSTADDRLIQKWCIFDLSLMHYINSQPLIPLEYKNYRLRINILYMLGDNSMHMFFLSYMQLGLCSPYSQHLFSTFLWFLPHLSRPVDREELEIVTMVEEPIEHSSQGICEMSFIQM